MSGNEGRGKVTGVAERGRDMKWIGGARDEWEDQVLRCEGRVNIHSDLESVTN